ncbi:hypothetical protein [Bradyrhizobium sp. CCBAU 51753]|uniref:hypothetical protein n=1 Tax=Bradyrhizobium sp. CCBAU 51753 TaxID=1325100 RepID=UPI00188CD89D|nr:hypothetical protein [Bradyrhizobium sp. CCBAU 51753]QOZ25346.1 hypothetical protein XH93_18395 [Bradyrhizobium sp. CCBAU 51753]
MIDLDRWLNVAVPDDYEPPVRFLDGRTEALNKVKVTPETKALLDELGQRLGIGPGGVAGSLIEELAAQGTLAQTWRAQNNRHRKIMYRLRREAEQHQANNPCGCGETCEDKSDDCRYLHRARAE